MPSEKSESFLIIPPDREKHGYDIDHMLNRIFVSPSKVRRVRNLFNGKTPYEQLALFYLINEKVLQEDVRSEVRDIIMAGERDFFEDVLLREDVRPFRRNFVNYITEGEGELFINKSGHKPRKNERDLHHIIPRSRRSDGFDTGRMENKFRDIGKKFHQYWHALYRNNHPLEILREDFNRNAQVLSRETRSRLGGIITLGNDDFYDEEVRKVE